MRLALSSSSPFHKFNKFNNVRFFLSYDNKSSGNSFLTFKICRYMHNVVMVVIT